jgi:hypothetical protein
VNHAPPAVATYLYQACLLLYPERFRLEFGDEMVSDFDEATADAWHTRRWSGVFAVWTLVGVDFARTVAIQWLKTGLPALIVLSAIWSMMIATLIAQQFVPRAPMLAAPRTPDEEVSMMLVGMGVLIWLIAAIIAVTGWFWMLVIRRKRRA